MKTFNTTGVCVPEKNYMVNIESRLKQIKAMIDRGDYFTINRSRQFGKTTTIYQLCGYLRDAYDVISLDFQMVGEEDFVSADAFVKAIARQIIKAADRDHVRIPEDIRTNLIATGESEKKEHTLDRLFDMIRVWCATGDKKIVLIIDEVDSATNNQVFLDFLAQLRAGYLGRDKTPAFQSVILAGVTDVKHLRRRMRPEEEHKVNSPWNIAKDFDIDMSFSVSDICSMLDAYEKDHLTGMHIDEVAQMIRDYTSGYPFLVSRLCELTDTGELGWNHAGITESVKRILMEKNTLFDSLMGKLTNMPELKHMLREMLMRGKSISYNPDHEDTRQLEMYGFIVNKDQKVTIANRIFEMRLYNLFLVEEELKNNIFSEEGDAEKSLFIKDGRLDIDMVLERFVITWHDVMGDPAKGGRFREKDGREMFLLYLKPIINGCGNYYIEAQTRDQTRTDIIVDYKGQQNVIECKIWHGDAYNQRGEAQLSSYLDYFHLKKGYMLSFNFNQKKATGLHTIQIGDKEIVEAVV